MTSDRIIHLEQEKGPIVRSIVPVSAAQDGALHGKHGNEGWS